MMSLFRCLVSRQGGGNGGGRMDRQAGFSLHSQLSSRPSLLAQGVSGRSAGFLYWMCGFLETENRSSKVS